GVDCSDHEVNIKILLGGLLAAGKLDPQAREGLLVSMTDDVATLVLAHNYSQTLALSLQQSSAFADNAEAQVFMSALESRGRLDRKVEGLPSNVELEARKAQQAGLYRPELAVTMAYGKIVLFDDIVASSAPDDAGFETVLVHYFPPALGGYRDEIRKHRLHREIIATVMANAMVDIAGPTFAPRLMKSAGVDTTALILAFQATRMLFGVKALWDDISALDNQVPASAQLALYSELARFVRRQTYWQARRFNGTAHDLNAMITPYEDGVETLLSLGEATLSASAREWLQTQVARLTQSGAPISLARRIMTLATFHHAADIIDLATGMKKPLDKTAELYFLTGERFGFDQLRAAAATLSSPDPWDRMATRRLIEDVLAEQKAVVRAMMSRMALNDTPEAIAASWEADNGALIAPLRKMMADMSAAAGGEGWSFAKLTIVNATLREWVARL
ncbi:MAG: NAD-glutamate dehydrogenase domain-containing protein, partial [Asticcacaulis sp.]